MPELTFCQIRVQFYEPVYNTLPRKKGCNQWPTVFLLGVFKEFFSGLSIDPLQRHTLDTGMLRGYTDAYNKSYGFNAYPLQTRVSNKKQESVTFHKIIKLSERHCQKI